MAPNKQQIADIFDRLAEADTDGFFQHVDPNVGMPPEQLYITPLQLLLTMIHVEWSVMSQSVLGGTYHSAAEFRSKTFSRLGKIMDPATPMKLKVHNIIGGGAGEEWCTVEMKNEGKSKSGMDYNQTYGWCVKWNEEGKIVQVRAYLDSALLRDVIEANE